MNEDPQSPLDKEVKENGVAGESSESRKMSTVSGKKRREKKRKPKLSSSDAEDKIKSDNNYEEQVTDQQKTMKHKESVFSRTRLKSKGQIKKVHVEIKSDTYSLAKKASKISSPTSRKFKSVTDVSRTPRISTIASSESSEASEDEDKDIITMTLPETTQKIIHCSIGENLFVDKTWCTVKKADILDDVAIQEANSPFSNIIYKIRAYKREEFLVGYEPFERHSNEFMICITEKGRDDVLKKLETEKENYLNTINKSKGIAPRPWVSLGSEMEVDDSQVKNKRDLINLEWTGDTIERTQHPGIFDDCDADSLKNGYTCLLPDKTLYKTDIRNKLDRDVQAVPVTREIGVDTELEVVTTTAIQCDAEVDLKHLQEQLDVSDESVAAFLNKHVDKILDEISYNEIYDLYQDDYLELRVNEDTDVHKYDDYKQYQSFTDVTAVEGKLVIDTSWHPTYTGIVAVAYASEIPCMMKELEDDSDQTDYEEEKSDEDESEDRSIKRLDDSGAKEWLQEERRERERMYIETDTERYEKAVKRLKEVEKYKAVWNAKMHEEGDNVHRWRETISEPSEEAVFDYVIYNETPEIVAVKKSIQVAESSVKFDLTEELETEKIPEDEDQVSVEYQTVESSEVDIRQTESVEDTEQDIKVSVSIQKSSGSILVPSILERGSIDSALSEVLTQATDYLFNEDDEISFFSQGTERSSTVESVRMDSQQKPSLTKKKQNLQGSVLKRSLKKKIQDKRKKQFQIEDSMATEIETVESEMESFEEMSDDGIGEADMHGEKLPPLLMSHNPVLIWSFVNDLSPKLILESPYDVTCIEFSMHDGNYIAGGTTCGQIVLWDITDRIKAVEKPEELTSGQQKYRKIMEDMMSWRYDIRSKRRVKVSGICSHSDSHMGKISSLHWVNPAVVVTNTGQMIPYPDEGGLSMCIYTSSVTGRIKFWNIDLSNIMKHHKRRWRTKARFQRPSSLDFDVTSVQNLYRTWSPFLTLLVGTLQLPVMVSSIHKVTGKRIQYERLISLNPAVKETLEDRIQFTPIITRTYTHVSQHVFGSTVFGDVGNITWQSPEQAPLSKSINTHAWWWHSVHDGPVIRIAQHDFIPELCLSVGGHVFAIWHTHDKVDPIMTKRYYGVYITDGLWSPLRPSLIRIARSDGVVEIWDLMIQSHAPATTIIISGQIITKLSSPMLPEVQGLLGIADYNSAFRLFYVPVQFRIWTPYELDRLKQFVHREPGRQQSMRDWSKWWQGSHINIERDEKRKMKQKEKEEKDELMEKEKEEEARKKYNEEVYKWYMRRRGKAFTWKEEAEERLQARQEELIHEVIQKKKRIDRARMEVLMRPIIREEKNAAQKHAKAQARIKQADAIFRATVNIIFPKTTTKEDDSKSVDSTMEGIHETIESYFGESYNNLAEDQLDYIQRSPWHFDSAELLDKYSRFRVLFNDRRRKRNKALRWLRKKLRDELIQAGYKIHVRRSHKDRYKYKKIKRREENIEWLRNMYGDDYNVYWDVVQPCRRFSDRKFHFAGDLSSGPTSLFDTSRFKDDEEDLEETYSEKRALSIKEESVIMDVYSKQLSVDKELRESEASSIQLPKESVFSKIDSRVSAISSVREPESSKEIMSLSEIKPVPSPLTVDRLTALITDVGYTVAYDDNLMNELDYISQPVTGPDQVSRARPSQIFEHPMLALQEDVGMDEFDEAEFTEEEDEGEADDLYELEEEYWEDMFSEEGVVEELEGIVGAEEEYDVLKEEEEEVEEEEDTVETAERILEVAENHAEEIEDETTNSVPGN